MSTPRWTDDMIYELIHYYRENPVLWCTKHVNYRNKRIKDQLYQTLSQKLAVSSEELKKKFCNLRTQFAKEQTKVVTSCSSATTPGDVYVPGWHFYKALSFLRDGPEYKESPTNIEVVYNSVPDICLEDEVQENEDLDSESNSSLAEFSQNFTPHTSSQVFPRRRKRKNEEADTTSSGSLKTLKVIANPIENKTNVPLQMDSNEAFGVFIARELDTIEDSSLVNETKFRIHELLFKAKRNSY